MSHRRGSERSLRVTAVRFNVEGLTFAKVYHWAPLDPRNTLELADALFAFIVEIGAESSDPQALYKSPTVLASRYLVWSALRQNPEAPTRVRGMGVVADERVMQADAIFDVNCGDLGPFLKFPDIRCMVRDQQGAFQPLHLQPFRSYRSFLKEEETTI